MSSVWGQNIHDIIISTEVDSDLIGATFNDRQALILHPPDLTWSGSTSDIFFDPANIPPNTETGLDAFHVGCPRDNLFPDNPGTLYFSTEVDVTLDNTLYRDEQLLAYEPATGTITPAFDTRDILELGGDFGLDAATPAVTGCSCYPVYGWAFSTEVSGQYFNDGDILITDGRFLIEVIDLTPVFGGNVGIDALHMLSYQADCGGMYRSFAISTETDGCFGEGDDRTSFTDQDVLILDFFFDQLIQPPHLILHGQSAFGADVGLDALYIPPVPEPPTCVTLILGALALLKCCSKNHLQLL
jgi:hypothetical protein